MPSHFHITTLIVVSILIFAFWHVSTVQPDIFELHEILAHGTDRIELDIKSRVVQCRIRIFRNANSHRCRPIFDVRSAVKTERFCTPVLFRHSTFENL